MVRLTARSLNKLQNCIVEIYSDLNIETFHGTMVSAIAKLIPATSVGYAEVNLEKIELSKNVIQPFIALSPDQVTAFETHLRDHPLMHRIYPNVVQAPPDGKNGSGSRALDRDSYVGKALKIHDILTRDEFRNLGLYNEFYRKLDIEFQMILFLHCGRLLNRNLAINRDRRDFTEEERLLLNLLAPHMIQALMNAEAHEKARQAFTVLESSRQSLKSFGLTGREEDVLYWVAQGKTNAEAARILKIAPGTVKIHLERIYQKMGVENRTTAAALAVEMAEIKKSDR